jgi:hypothetical protein
VVLGGWCGAAACSYYKQVFEWSSTLTGAAQMSGDILAAVILALTTTKCWAGRMHKKGGGRVAAIPWEITMIVAALSCIIYERHQSPSLTRVSCWPIGRCCCVWSVTVGSLRCFERWVLAPPWNLSLLFGLYCGCFILLAQPTFALSVTGQVTMGTVFVRQLVLELPSTAHVLICILCALCPLRCSEDSSVGQHASAGL